MKKEFELFKIVNAYKVLEGSEFNFSIAKLNLKLKGKTAFKVSILKSKLKDIYNSAESCREALIKQYGEIDENNNNIISIKNQDNFNLFIKEYNEVLKTIHEIDFIPFVLEDFDDIQELPVEFSDNIIHFFEM